MLEQLVASRMFHDTRIYVPLARGPEKGLAPLAFRHDCRSAIKFNVAVG